MRKQMGQSTQSIWGGEQEHELFERSTQVPVVHSVSFAYKDIDTWQKVALGQEPGHIYSRNTNPTVRAFEDKVKTLEGAQAATSYASGMAAISNTLATFVQPGDRIVSIKDSYGGTNYFPRELARRYYRCWRKCNYWTAHYANECECGCRSIGH